MSSMTKQYSETASRATGVAERAADRLEKGTKELGERLPVLVPRVNLVPAVERYFNLVHRVVDMNRDVAVRWARAVGTVSGKARKQAESAGEAMNVRVESAGEAVRERAESFKRTAEEQAGKAERVQAELAREARRIERQETKRAHEKARARYEGMTKAELSNLLAQRDLPKSGNLDELVERLVEADSK